MRERMIERLRDVVKRARPVDQELFQFPLGTELVRIQVDLRAETGKVHGQVPLDRRAAVDQRARSALLLLPPAAPRPVVRRARTATTSRSSRRRSCAITGPRSTTRTRSKRCSSNGKERIVDARVLRRAAVAARPPAVAQEGRTAPAPSTPRHDRILQQLGVDETQRASAGQLRLGVPRSPYRERLVVSCSAASGRAPRW